MKKKIIFLDKYWGNRITGPTVWRDNLICELKKNNSVELISFKKNSLDNILFIFCNLKKISKCDIIQTHVSTFPIIFCCIVSRILGKKNVHMLHGDFYEESKDKGFLYKAKYVLILNLANTIVFPTDYLKKIIVNKIGNKPRCVIPPGINYSLKKAHSPKKINSFLEITSFTRYKKCLGLKILIEAFNEVKEKNDELIIIGGGKYLQEFKDKYSSDQIKFLGRQNNVNKFIKKCDAFVHSSFLESFGIVILEAMAYHKPILTVDVQGIPQALGKGGILVKPTKKGIINGIKKLKKTNFLEMFKEQKKQLKLFDWKLIGKNFNTLYLTELNKTIFIVRHGKTSYNLQKKITGQQNPSLAKEGEKDATRAGVFFKRVPFSKVYCSDLKRATSTALEISNDFIKTKKLRELDFGELSSKKISEIKKTKLKKFLTQSLTQKFPNGESLNDLKKRLELFLEKNKLKNRTILVAHEGTNKMLKSILTKTNYDFNESQKNNEIWAIETATKKVHKIELTD